VETVVCHRVNTPEEIVALAGTREVPRYSTRYTRAGSTGEGSMQRRDEAKVDANVVRGLSPGEAFVISRGMAMRAQMLRAPPLRSALPPPRSAAERPPPGEPGGPHRAGGPGGPAGPAEQDVPW